MKPLALPLGRGVAVLARDASGLIALDKPAGLLAHPNKGGEEKRSLVEAHYDLQRAAYKGEFEGRPFEVFLLNRLDSATSGVILLAENEALATVIRARFKDRRVKKVYVARVFGRLPPAPALWRDKLAIQKQGGAIRTSAGGNVPSETAVRLLRGGRAEPATSLIRLEPHTGRSHQLRVQCAKRGFPIVGDQTYGDFRRNRDFAKHTGMKRLFLHSAETSFEYEFGGKTHRFGATAAVPAEFEESL